MLQYFWIQMVLIHSYYCSLCLAANMSILVVLGYGQSGPLSQRAGYDAMGSAVFGLMHITGSEVGFLL